VVSRSVIGNVSYTDNHHCEQPPHVRSCRALFAGDSKEKAMLKKN
jgi:hypothetical protein